MTTTTVLTANIAGRRRRVRQLVAAIREHRPDQVVVEEASRARWWLRLVRGYKLRQYTRAKGTEAPGIAVLVRRPRVIVRRWPMRMRRAWHGPHGKRHDGRVLPVLITDQLPALCGVHAPWPYGTAAWWECFRRVVSWLENHPGGAMAPGDWNAEVRELVRALQDRNTRVQLVRGTKVDHCLTIGLEHAWTKRLRQLQPEGMHGWVLYGFRAGDGA